MAGLATTLEACARELSGRRLKASAEAARAASGELCDRQVERAWAAAGRAVHDLSLGSIIAPTEAEACLLDAVFDPLAPPWLIVDGLIALIVEQVAVDAHPDQVRVIDESLDGLRGVVACLRRQLWGGA